MAKKPDPTDAPAPAHEAITIRCTQPGFRRGGVAHPAEATYPAGTFTAEQIAAFEAEARLVVTPAEAA